MPTTIETKAIKRECKIQPKLAYSPALLVRLFCTGDGENRLTSVELAISADLGGGGRDGRLVGVDTFERYGVPLDGWSNELRRGGGGGFGRPVFKQETDFNFNLSLRHLIELDFY